MKAKDVEMIANHIDAIERNFGMLRVDRRKFWNVARRAECRLRRANEYFLSDPNFGVEMVDKIQRSVYRYISRCFENPEKIGRALFVNTDPRGYALKLKGRFDGIEIDFGGDGILAPDF